jgi:hypothetical protein
MFYTSNEKRWSYRSILGVILGVIIFSGLLSVLFSKKALASTYDYIDNISYTDNGLSFHVKTTFTIDNFYIQYNSLVCSPSYFGTTPYTGAPPYYYYVPYFTILPDDFTYPFIPETFTFYAGQTYHVKLVFGKHDYSYCGYGNDILYGDIDNLAYYPLPDTLTITYFGDNLTIQKETFPSVSISYPHDNDEIAGAFNVQGSFTIPAGKSADYISINFNPVGAGYSLLEHFSQYISGQNQGNFSIPISGIPAGYYDITISFVGGDYDGFIGAIIYNVYLVNDIPPALSTGETTPSSPNFNFISPDDYYLQHSNYSTSTGLFNTLTNSVGALIQSVGNSLSAFAGKFSLSDAQQTATMVASSISTIRTYSNNLNSFFGSLPVSQILFLYLIIFVAVVVFRLIKNLVNLIKP